jgi:putative ABC transport system substrate-binding protein
MGRTQSRFGRRALLQGSLGLGALSVLQGCGALPLPRDPLKVPRLGFLARGPREARKGWIEAFLQGLRGHGYAEGRDITIEWRFADGGDERFRELATELVELKLDVIVVAGSPATRAAGRATATIPIVFAAAADPVGTGLVASLARPGGNVTGLSQTGPQLTGKRLELLREAVPTLSRVAVLGEVANPIGGLDWRETQAAGLALGLQVDLVQVRDADDLEPAFTGSVIGQSDALVVLTHTATVSHRAEIVALAARQRLPSMSEIREFVAAGGLMAYGPSFPDLFRRAATYVDKILKGARPADLPVEQPTKFDFVVNLKTARALGLTIPPSVLQQATEVIE